MAATATWKGHLKISLVTIPVQAYSASAPAGGRISLNQLHSECHSRIRYLKTCPIHGEVPNSEIVSGYEYEKGKYVIVDPDELQQLRSESDRSLDVSAFVKADAIDPLYYSGKSYYLLPDGKTGEKPYRLIQQTMREKRVHAVAQIVISKKEELVVMRPVGELLSLSMLHYGSQVKDPAGLEDQLPEVHASKPETQLTGQLIDTLMSRKFDIHDYHDVYTEKLQQLIEAKVEGREIVAPVAVKEPQVISLMDAIKQSIKRTGASSGKKSTSNLPVAKLRKPSAVARKTPLRKRKVS